MGVSKEDRAVSAIGREIEKALGDRALGDVLSRWMAYRLAEVRLHVEGAAGPEEKRHASSEQDTLIMALWARRRSLSAPLPIDERTGRSAEMIDALLADPSPWWNQPGPISDPVAAITVIGDAWRTLATDVAVLTYRRKAADLGDEDPDLPLTSEEEQERARWAELERIILSDSLPIARLRSDDGGISSDEAIKHHEKRIEEAFAKLRNRLSELEALLLDRSGQ